MAYYHFPRKEKSRRTIEKERALKDYDRIISQSQLEKLSNEQLEEQKQLFLKDIKELNDDYSLLNFDKNLKKINDKINKISKLCADHEVLIKKNRDLIRTSISYYKEEAIFFSDCLTIQRVTCTGDLNELIKAEKEIFSELESKEYLDLNIYFYKIASLIEKYYLIFDLNLFKGKFYPWSSVVDSQIKMNFDYDHLTGNKRTLPNTFLRTVEAIMISYPDQGKGGSLYKPKSTYEEFIKKGKVPTWGGHHNESSWDNSFHKFSKCSKTDHNKVALVLRFDEINYSKLIERAGLANYDNKIMHQAYKKEGRLIERYLYNKFLPLAQEPLNRILRRIELILRSRKRSIELAENSNYVYIFSNKSYPKNTYKIGWTSGLPEDRADQLSSETGVLHPFKVEYSKKFKDAENVEKKIHQHFNEYRVRKNKEYFDLDIKKIKIYIEGIEGAKIRTKKYESELDNKLLEDEEW